MMLDFSIQRIYDGVVTYPDHQFPSMPLQQGQIMETQQIFGLASAQTVGINIIGSATSLQVVQRGPGNADQDVPSF